jgi:iron complex transport system substrate-binding protein
MRIVSLLPSATEILCGLGLRDQLVGITHECDFPASLRGLKVVTKTRIPESATSQQIDALVREKLQPEKALYALDADALKSLQPDLIVTQTLCDVCAVAHSEVAKAARSLSSQPKLVNLEPIRLADLFNCIRQVAAVTDCVGKAESYIAQLQQRVDQVAQRTLQTALRPRTVMLEWIDPLFSAGHWNPELVELAGGHELIGLPAQRSSSIAWASLVAANPECLVIACCGFNVQRTLQDLSVLTDQPHWQTLACVRSRQVFVIDGSAYFNRPGPRLVDSLEILAHTLHPALHQLPTGLEAAHRVV